MSSECLCGLDHSSSSLKANPDQPEEVITVTVIRIEYPDDGQY